MIQYKKVAVSGLDIFYREAGNPENPSILLLHGFPSSSHMYRDLISSLQNDFHLVAPDYPGFGYSSFPDTSRFDYTFDKISEVIESFCKTIGLTSFSPFVQDYGAPVGFRIAERNPDWIETLLIQNGNAYEEGIGQAFDPIRKLWEDRNKETEQVVRDLSTLEITKWQYLNGTKNPDLINPDSYMLDQLLLDRPGNKDIQLELQYDYRNNVLEYPKWHQYFENYQPPALIVWGKNDEFFPIEGAYAYNRHLENTEIHLLDTGHFPLEEYADITSGFIRKFLNNHQ